MPDRVRHDESRIFRKSSKFHHLSFFFDLTGRSAASGWAEIRHLKPAYA
jgi:hypothetical protein